MLVPVCARGEDDPPRGLYRVNVANLSSSADADVRAMLPARVIHHVDGDTVRVEIAQPPRGIAAVETIRLLGVDSPETRGARGAALALGRASSDYTRSRLLGQEVLLAFDWDLRDRYGRLLAYVYLTDGSCHNADLIRDGYAHAYTRFPFQFLREFRSLEREARRQRRGLWQ